MFPPSGSASPLNSSNWSGYVELNGPFSEVTGTFSVPSLVAGTSPADQIAVWVGIDGGNGDNSLIQAGFNESPDPGSASGFVIQPWWEILPASETYINSVEIEAGDTVTVAIAQISGTQWGITLTDNTNGESFTTDQTYSGPASTAEWIVEALTVNGGVSALAPYSPAVSFSDLGFVGTDTTLQEVVMVQAGTAGVHALGADGEWIRRRLRQVAAPAALITGPRRRLAIPTAPRGQPARTARSCHSPGTPFEGVLPPIVEGDARPDDKIAHGTGGAYLPGFGQGTDPRRDVDGQSSDVIAPELDLAHVQSGPDRNAEVRRRLHHGHGAPDALGGPGEPCQRAVARVLHERCRRSAPAGAGH